MTVTSDSKALAPSNYAPHKPPGTKALNRLTPKNDTLSGRSTSTYLLCVKEARDRRSITWNGPEARLSRESRSSEFPCRDAASSHGREATDYTAPASERDPDCLG